MQCREAGKLERIYDHIRMLDAEFIHAHFWTTVRCVILFRRLGWWMTWLTRAYVSRSVTRAVMPPARPVVLVIAAHPDDEVLGCAGTIVRHTSVGDEVHIALLTDGVSSRGEEQGREAEILRRRASASEAAKILGANPPYFLDFPDQRLDSVPLIEIVHSIERLAAPM